MPLMTLPVRAQLSFLSARTTLSLATRVAVSVAYTFAVWDQRYRSRLIMREMSESQLEDIGVTRAEMHREAGRPFFRGDRFLM